MIWLEAAQRAPLRLPIAAGLTALAYHAPSLR